VRNRYGLCNFSIYMYISEIIFGLCTDMSHGLRYGTVLSTLLYDTVLGMNRKLCIPRWNVCRRCLSFSMGCIFSD
jgi:hypothetical protein